MKLRTKVLAAAGALAVAAAVLWRPVAEPRLVVFPAHLDRTMQYTGTATVYVDPQTGAALATPVREPLTVERHLRTVAGGGAHTVVIRETLTFRAGSQVITEDNQYVINNRTMQNVRSPLSWAIVPTNIVDRSGSYSVNLPMGASTGHTYKLWKSEVGTTETLVAGPGAPSRVSGVATVGFSASLPATPVVEAQQTKLVDQGMPAQLTPTQVQAHLSAAGVDLPTATRTLMSTLSAPELARVTAILSTPVPLHYLWAVSGSMAVNHTTGALLEVPVDNIMVSAQPDMSGLVQLGQVLAVHAQAPGVPALQRQLQSVLHAAPQPVYTLTFSETAASAASTARTVRHQLFLVRVARTYIPWGLFGLGVLLLAAAAATIFITGRPRPSVVPAPAAPAEPPATRRAA